MASVHKFVDPVVFEPYYRPQVWGGRGLSAHLGRELPDDRPYGEAWDLSPQKLHVSRVGDGAHMGRDLNEIWSLHRHELAGPSHHEVFPLLIKWLECKELLSLQVHPDDAMAQAVLNEPYGKSEAWIVIAAEPTAKVYAGLKSGVTKSDVLHHLAQGTLVECLHSFTPRPGDCVALPAGTIHAAGGGMIAAEVQQSSDATFRLFDWNRLGLDGQPRPLQIERALEATNWNQGPVRPVATKPVFDPETGLQRELLVESHGFRLERFTATRPFHSPHQGELFIAMVLGGSAYLDNSATGSRREVPFGTTVMIPASARGTRWTPASEGPLVILGVSLTDRK